MKRALTHLAMLVLGFFVGAWTYSRAINPTLIQLRDDFNQCISDYAPVSLNEALRLFKSHRIEGNPICRNNEWVVPKPKIKKKEPEQCYPHDSLGNCLDHQGE